MLTRKLRMGLRIGVMVFLAVFSSCERINDSAHKEDFEDAKSFLYFQHAAWVSIQMAEHINSTGSTLGINFKSLDTLSKQLNAEFNIFDSTYLDNNGIQYELSFTENTHQNYNPYLHFTRYHFDGKLNVEVNQNYREIGSKSTLTITESSPLKIDYPGFGKVEIYGKIELERTGPNLIKVDYKDFKIRFDSEIYDWDADLEYSWLKGAETDGIWNDQIKITGKGEYVEKDESDGYSEFNILNHLTKSFEPGCSDYIQTGIVTLKTEHGEYVLDFDPFKNASCGSLVRINRKNEEFEFQGP